MGKSKRSKGSSSSSGGGVDAGSMYIGVVDMKLGKHKNYTGADLPRTMTVTIPSSKKKKGAGDDDPSALFMSFSDKEYHPIGILNSTNDDLLSDSSIKMKMTIEIEQESGIVARHEITSPLAEKAYWFRPILFHVTGKFTYTFSLQLLKNDHRYDIEPFEWKGVCLAPDGNAKGYKDRQEVTVAAAADDDDDNNDDDIEEPISKKQKVDKKSSKKAKAKHAEDDEYEDDFADLETDEVYDSKRKQTVGSLLPYPEKTPLKKKSRLERGLPMMGDGIDIRGPGLELKLPPSLVVALLDDRNNATVANKDSAVDFKGDDPTVNDLLFRCQRKFENAISDNELYINQIRCGFEYSFESCVLYSSEKKRFKKVIEKCRTNKTLFGDVFGAIYLLRFIVILALNADLSNDHDTNGGTIDDAILASTIDSNDLSSSSSIINQHSSKRRAASMTKKMKEAFFKTQAVVSSIVKELDDDAHYLF